MNNILLVMDVCDPLNDQCFRPDPIYSRLLPFWLIWFIICYVVPMQIKKKVTYYSLDVKHYPFNESL